MFAPLEGSLRDAPQLRGVECEGAYGASVEGIWIDIEVVRAERRQAHQIGVDLGLLREKSYKGLAIVLDPPLHRGVLGGLVGEMRNSIPWHDRLTDVPIKGLLAVADQTRTE